MQKVVDSLDPQWWGVLKTVSRELRAAVQRGEEGRGAVSRIPAKLMYARVELLSWALSQSALINTELGMQDAAGTLSYAVMHSITPPLTTPIRFRCVFVISGDCPRENNFPVEQYRTTRRPSPHLALDTA
jgi:hypothetical protein